MADISRERMRKQRSMKHFEFTLKVGQYAYKGLPAALERASGKVVVFDNTPGLVYIGCFDETKDATAAAKRVSVDLGREVIVEFFDNDSTSPVSATTGILGGCWMTDNHSVGADPAAGSFAGTVWIVDSKDGVGVERVCSPALDLPLTPGPTLAFTADAVAPTSILCGAVYDVPTTAANSTITLPAAAPDGTWAIFVADGSKNGHTVQYVDATGTANITAALTASKRHQVRVQKSGGKWFALSTVSP